MFSQAMIYCILQILKIVSIVRIFEFFSTVYFRRANLNNEINFQTLIFGLVSCYKFIFQAEQIISDCTFVHVPYLNSLKISSRVFSIQARCKAKLTWAEVDGGGLRGRPK